MRRVGLLILLLTAAAAGDVVVLRDRTVLHGSVSEDRGKLVAGGRPLPLKRVLLWEDDEGLARRPVALRDQLAAIRELARRETLRLCRERLEQALAAKAPALARKLLERAEQAGLDGAEAERWEDRIRSLQAEGGKPPEIAVPGIEVPIHLLVRRARAALDADRERRAFELLREALRADSKNEQARELLEEVAPAHWRVGDPSKDDIPRIWLDWQLDVIEEGVRAVGRRQPDIQRARRTWGRPLHGVQSQEIVFVTPLTDSRIVGMCVKYARITCRALDRMFHTDNPQRSPEDFLPLVIYMYESRKEYMEKASFGSGAPPRQLQFTAGFYVRGENISRFFWPGGPDAEYSIRHTFVHELTHHWIERRNPRWHARDLADAAVRATTPGFWIVEGMATFVEEGRYDIHHARWSHFNPQAASLDNVAALSRARAEIEAFNKKQAKEKDKRVGLIPWKKLYTLTQVQFNDGRSLRPTQPSWPIRRKWALRPMPTSEMRLFYEQAAASCHFLYWGEGGKYRERLLQYVTDFYTSKAARTDIQAAFGLTPEELGRKVEAFARAVIHDGWRPGKS